MTRSDFWANWFTALGIVLVAFGLGLAFFNQSLFFEALVSSNVDPVFWGTTMVPAASLSFQRWAYAVLGATVAGWGVFLAFLGHYPFRKKEPWAWYCILVGVLAWYLPDTVLSIQFKVVFNAVFNTILLILVVLPLVITRRQFSKRPSSGRRRHSRKGAQ